MKILDGHTGERDAQAGAEGGPFAALKRFAAAAPQVERCGLCGAVLESVHPHLLEREQRAVVCACSPCAILFSDRRDGKFLRIPADVRPIRDLQLDDLQWEELAIPIRLAFFVRAANGRMKVLYPSPAGAIESSLPLQPLPRFLAENRAIAAMAPEIEALLVSRVAGEEAALLVPIDECFRLTGLIRQKWRGLSGGAEVWRAIGEFFAALRKRAGLPAPAGGARNAGASHA